MIMIGITAPAKMAVSPDILYHAATALNESATSSVKLEKVNILFIIISIYSKRYP
jgi:hypothetical protein